MKIKFNQDYNYSFDCINPTSFKQGHIYENLSDSFCELMIERGYAVNAEPKEIIIENKKAHIEEKKVLPETKKVKVSDNKVNIKPPKKRKYRRK